MKIIYIRSIDQQIDLRLPGEYWVIMDQPGSVCQISVSRYSFLDQVAKYHLTIHHQASRTKATTMMKSAVDSGGNVLLRGKIIIDKDAYGCSSFLTQKILLLDPSAKGEAVPELEILNNDVQCSHAASISSIPDEQLHYLMARGLSRKQATQMIAEGFLRG